MSFFHRCHFRLLLEHGCDVNITVDQNSLYTPLHLAAIHGCLKVLYYFVKLKKKNMV
jgi:ankyrin repeat protein